MGFEELNFHGAVDWSTISDVLMDVPWEDALGNRNVSEMWKIIQITLFCRSECHTPPRFPKKKRKIPRRRRILYRKKRRYHEKMIWCSSAHRKQKLQRKINDMEIQIRKSIESNLLKAIQKKSSIPTPKEKQQELRWARCRRDQKL